jgi:hypothetical protein
MDSHAQQNLVSNPSFDEHSDCPYDLGQISFAVGWTKVRGSVDYYNVCGSSDWHVPDNYAGFQNPFDGAAYGGLAVWGDGASNFREYVGTELLVPLLSESKYDVSIKLSLADTVQFAIKNFGFVFTLSQPVNDIGILLGLQTQVAYSGASFLDDSTGWMTVEGSFIASGGEQFLTIGNFDNDIETDTLRVRWEGIPASYYYIDDVSVVQDTSYYVGLDDPLAFFNEQLAIYPNPATDLLTIDAKGKNLTFELLNTQGKAMLQRPLRSARQSMEVSHLPAGIYVAVLRQQGVAVARRKVVIQR